MLSATEEGSYKATEIKDIQISDISVGCTGLVCMIDLGQLLQNAKRWIQVCLSKKRKTSEG